MFDYLFRRAVWFLIGLIGCATTPAPNADRVDCMGAVGTQRAGALCHPACAGTPTLDNHQCLGAFETRQVHCDMTTIYDGVSGCCVYSAPQPNAPATFDFFECVE